MKAIRLGLDHLPSLAILFDAYRVWYGADSDVNAAEQFLRRRLEADESVIYGVLQGEDLVAFAQLYPSFSSVSIASIWALNDLFVVEDQRGTGCGRLLMEAAATHARTTGAIRLELATAHDNGRAQRLYEGLGYVLDEDFRHYSLSI